MADEIKYYDFAQSQYVLRQAEGLCGKVYNNLMTLLNFEQDDIDPNVLEKALNMAIERFPSALTRIGEFKKSELEAKEGHEVKVSDMITDTAPYVKDPIIPKLYFVEKSDSRCERMSFKSDKKMYKFLDKLVKTPFPNNYNDCDLYKVILIKRANGRYSVLLKFYHVIADTYGILQYCKDFIAIYKSLTEGSEMPEEFLPILPALEECWAYEESEQEQKDKKFWDEFWDSVEPSQFATINGFENKKCYIRGKKYGNFINLFNVKAKQVNYRVPAELTKRVNEFSEANGVSPKVLYMLSMHSWMSKKCDDCEAFTFRELTASRSKLKFAKTTGSFVVPMSNYVDIKTI